MLPMSQGVNSTYSPFGRAPWGGEAPPTLNEPRSPGWPGKGRRFSGGPGQGMGGGGSMPNAPRNPDAGGALRASLTLPRPAGPVMGPGRSYPRSGMPGFDG